METTGTGKNPKVTNLEYLKKLSKGNDQFMREMIRIFLEENPDEIKTLEKAIEESDFGLIHSAAHKLRSTIPFVGIDKLIAGEISEIEALAQNKTEPMFEMPEPETKKPSVIPTDRELLQRITALFRRIKDTCYRAYEELKVHVS